MALTLGSLDSLTLGELDNITLGELDTLTYGELMYVCQQRLSALKEMPDKRVTLSRRSAETICKITDEVSEHLSIESLTTKVIFVVIYKLLSMEIDKVAQSQCSNAELLKQILDILYEIIN